MQVISTKIGDFLQKQAERPVFLLFFQYWHTVLPGDRYPQMSAVAQMLWIPDVCHEHIVGTMEHLLLRSCLHLIYIGTLRTEGLVGFLTTARIRELLPRTIDILSPEHASRIRSPTRTSACNHPVSVFRLEDRWSFVLSTGSHSYITAIVRHVIICELGDLERQVILRRVDMICLSVIIDEDGHVSCHLSTSEVTHPEHTSLYLRTPLWCPPLLHLWEEELMAKVGGVWLGESYRIDTRVHSTRAHKLERSERT